jgi:putative redox protein
MADEEQQVSVTWTEGMRFEGRTPEGAVTTLDGEGGLSPTPTRLLLESLGGCAGIDVVEILRKGRQGVEGLTVEVSGVRRPETPRHFTRLALRFRIEGDVDRKAAERAVDLSLERYCSVFHTLRKDLAVETEVELE